LRRDGAEEDKKGAEFTRPEVKWKRSKKQKSKSNTRMVGYEKERDSVAFKGSKPFYTPTWAVALTLPFDGS